MAAPSPALAPRAVIGFRPPRFGLGGSQLGASPGPDGDSAAVATIDAAYQAGIRFFDTSPAYGDAERRLGMALQRRPYAEFLISTRVTGHRVRESVLASIDRLGLDVDLVFAEDERAYARLDELRRAGVIRAIGATSGDWRELDRIVRDGAWDCVLLAGQYSLFDRSATPLLDRCLGRGISVIVSGVLTPQVLQADKAGDPVAAVCEKYSVSLAQAALAFPSRHSAVTSVLISAANPAEIRADAALVRRPVPERLWSDPELLRLLT